MTYTREQILNMTAQELAEATAVHVMGWEWIERKQYESGDSLLNTLIEKLPYAWNSKTGEPIHGWNPAEDIAAAWEVLNVMRGKYSWVGVDSTNTGWRCLVISREDHEGGECYAATAPEAICKAALLAVMGL